MVLPTFQSVLWILVPWIGCWLWFWYFAKTRGYVNASPRPAVTMAFMAVPVLTTLFALSFFDCDEAWLEIYVPSDIGSMVLIPAGEFWMGGCGLLRSGGIECFGNQEPRVRVYLDEFRIDRYEVTQEEYQRVMGHNPSWFKRFNFKKLDHLQIS